MLRLQTPFRALIARAHRASDQLARGRRQLLEAIGVRLSAFTKQSLVTRSSGASSAGIVWRPLDRDYLRRKQRQGLGSKIGVASGRLFESLEATTGPQGVMLGFRAAHAPFFARRRPLLPEQLPAQWQKALETDVEAWAEDTFTANLEGR